MTITKDTRLAELLAEYPWLKEKLPQFSEKFKMLNSPVGKVMLGKATILEMSKKSGLDADVIINKLGELIQSHSA